MCASSDAWAEDTENEFDGVNTATAPETLRDWGSVRVSKIVASQSNRIRSRDGEG